jgi:hypothetical protein
MSAPAKGWTYSKPASRPSSNGTYKDRAAVEAAKLMGEDRLNAKRRLSQWDAAALLKLMWVQHVVRPTLGSGFPLGIGIGIDSCRRVFRRRLADRMPVYVNSLVAETHVALDADTDPDAD